MASTQNPGEPLLLVIGSVNYDLIFRHAQMPGPGEGVTGALLARSCGGKGANQAVVAARCARDRERFPIRVAFAGAIGDDDFGREQRLALERDRVDLAGLKVVGDVHTGTSSIWVETGSGQNRILSAPGANLRLLPEDLENLPFEQASLVLLQNETPASTLEAAVEISYRCGTPVIWNPAPVSGAELPRLEPGQVRFLTPNENEAAGLLGTDSVGDPQTAVRQLRELGYPGVVLTLGSSGVCVGDGDDIWEQPAPKVDPVDTTGAGDAFNGALAAALVAGWPVREAVEFGVSYASRSVCFSGTQTAFPYELPKTPS